MILNRIFNRTTNGEQSEPNQLLKLLGVIFTDLVLLSSLLANSMDQTSELVIQTGISFLTGSAVFSPNGLFAASICADRIVIWETASGRELKNFQCINIVFQAVQFSPDGRQIQAVGYRWTELNKIYSLRLRISVLLVIANEVKQSL